jgi:hypothetical protein
MEYFSRRDLCQTKETRKTIVTTIVRVPVVDSKAERKRADDLVEDRKEDRKGEEVDHREAEVDRRAAAAVLDRANVIVFVRAG